MKIVEEKVIQVLEDNETTLCNKSWLLSTVNSFSESEGGNYNINV